jgi:tellurite methyltransferase
MATKPFWEAGYADAKVEVFGPPSTEIVRLAASLPPRSRVLDMGCGEGRNALCLARAGHDVHAFDLSSAGVAKLLAAARREELAVRAWVADVRTADLGGPYDLIVNHGVLALLHRSDWTRVLARMRELTAPGGRNVVCVFTDRAPCPPDLVPFTHGLFRPGELRARYNGWVVEEWRSYFLHDEHPGGLRHVHAVEKIVARRPG